MSARATRGLFVTGTDTGVGKTHATVLAAEALRATGQLVGAYKPACSGVTFDGAGERRWEDVERLSAAIGGAFPRERVGPQCFDAPLAPPVAARREGRVVDAGSLTTGLEWWLGRVDALLIEGVGGLLCPLTETGTVADFAREAGFPLLIVARAELGTINHTLLTLDAADRRGLPVAAVLLNRTAPAESGPAADEAVAENGAEIARRGGVTVFGPLPWCGDAAKVDLRSVDSAVRIEWLPLLAFRSKSPLAPSLP
jgi:dethiobiotin synthetase